MLRMATSFMNFCRPLAINGMMPTEVHSRIAPDYVVRSWLRSILMAGASTLFVRISATDWVDGGWDLEQSIELCSGLNK